MIRKSLKGPPAGHPSARIFEDELFRERERVNVILSSINEAVVTTDCAGTITNIHFAGLKITGYSMRRAEGRPFNQVIKLIDGDTHKPVESPVREVMRKKKKISLKKPITLIRSAKREFPIEGVVFPLFDRKKKVAGSIFIFHDVTASHELSDRISYQQSHDQLTGLYSRSAFKQHLALLLKNAKRQNKVHALCYLDLDEFKIINDTCGHLAGDQLLKEVALALKQKVRQTDLIARLGGDEFGILLVNCSLPKANEISGAICKAVRAMHFIWKEKPFTVGASIGVVGINAASKGVENILSVADGSCYLAKEKGGNRAHLHLEDDRELSLRNGEMHYVPRITNALERNMFRLYYQPIVPVLSDGKKVWYEILLRMLDDGKIVVPVNFLPAAERYDMMPAIDRWVLKAFFSFFKDNLSGKVNGGNFTCDINVSGATLNDDSFLDFVKEQMSAFSVPPDTLCFEITETAAIANFNEALKFIGELKTIGCRFSLDDFGSGVSSFRYLKDLPVNYLKIDGSFVKNVTSNGLDNAIVTTINEIAHLMGIKTVAEFVETEAIFKKLREIKVDYAQGYWIAKPKPLEESLGN
jgi:diguanylate cyclase (GGDEF)-like protein/PAS domain S-box-containing protein